jgi:hypothetical protein
MRLNFEPSSPGATLEDHAEFEEDITNRARGSLFANLTEEQYKKLHR